MQENVPNSFDIRYSEVSHKIRWLATHAISWVVGARLMDCILREMSISSFCLMQIYMLSTVGRSAGTITRRRRRRRVSKHSIPSTPPNWISFSLANNSRSPRVNVVKLRSQVPVSFSRWGSLSVDLGGHRLPE